MKYFIPIIAFAGLLFGLLLRKVALEEVLSGKKYLKFLKRVLFFVLLLGLLYYSKGIYFYLVLGVLFGFLMGLYVDPYVFMGLSMVTAFLLDNQAMFFISIVIFIYGLAYGSLYSKKSQMGFVIKNLIYFSAPFLILYYFYDYFVALDIMKEFLIGVVSGGLFSLLAQRQ